MSDPSSVPWTAIVPSIVGIVGIVGALFGAHLGNSAAERRLRMEQEHDDRTRFHKERAELYGKLLTAAQGCRSVAGTIQTMSLEDRTEFQSIGDYSEIKAAIRQLNEARYSAELVASTPVRMAIGPLVGAAVTLTILASAEQDKFELANKKLLDSESEFTAAARAELLPKETTKN